MSRDAPGSSSGSQSGPQTCCSTCRTVFQVSIDLLHSADTRVRCGECYAIFDALTNLVDDRSTLNGGQGGTPGRQAGTPASARADAPGAASGASDRPVGGRTPPNGPGGPADDTSALDVTYSDFDLFSEDAELPEVAYLDRTRDTPEFDFDSVEPDADETFSDTLFEADVTQQAPQPLPTATTATTATIASSASRSVRLPEIEVDERTDGRIALNFRYQDPDPDDEPDPGEMRPVQRGPAGAAETTPAVSSDGAPAAAIAVPRSASPADPSPVGQAASRSDSVQLSTLPDADPQGDPASGVLELPEPLLPGTVLDSSPPPASRSWALPVMMLLGLCVLLAGLYVHRKQAVLHEDPLTRPVYQALCRITGCEVPLRSALDRLTLVERQMYSHPTLERALVIDVMFRNDADFVQALPAVSVKLSGPSGRLVARRTFEPGEYLEDPSEPHRMAPGERLRVDLDVDDPGRGASSFVIDFVAAQSDFQAD